MMEFFRDRILVLDGAMGTMIQKYGLTETDFHNRHISNEIAGVPQEIAAGPVDDVARALDTLATNGRELKGNNECLNITRPDIICDIHRHYIQAGADIIEANTFSANRISQSEYGTADLAYIFAREGARIARLAADNAGNTGRTVFVAGSVGPTSKSLTLAPDIEAPEYRPYSFRDMVDAYSEQIRGLMDGGADIILIETCFDALNAKAALYALEKLDRSRTFPAIVSVSVSDKSGRTLTGQTVEAFCTSVGHYPLTAFGLNCSLGADDLQPLVKEVAGFSPFPVICYPNAGLPNEMGGYDETPEQMADSVMKMADEGILNIIGGCCGTTPEHISAICKAVSRKRPRPIPEKSTGTLTVSGLEPVKIDLAHSNFTNIGERTNVAGSRKFARLIASGDYGKGLQIAAQQIENGARIIDINMDDAMLDSAKCMESFARHISGDPAVAKAALMIDSSHWESILAGLENSQGKCIVNSISLKEGEEAFLSKAMEIRDLGGAMVVMAFDEEGQATTYSRKIGICRRAYELLTAKAGIRPEDIIFDVNVLSVGTGIEEHRKYGVDFIEAVRWIKNNLPGALTSGGISNLSFAFRGNNTVREAMHSIFLYHAVKAGLDMGIVNPGMLQVYDDIEPDLLEKAEDVILDRRPDATERLIEKAQEILAAKESEKDNPKDASGTMPEVNQLTAEDRLEEALVKGRQDSLEADVMECYSKYGSAVKVIEGPLMAGMEKVGELFGAGKMFLPQVVKSAKIMKEAVSVLEPYMKGDGDGDSGRPVIVNATVKGDVHDIGKNITGIVLSCNGFNVIDLGVMVDKETILDEAARHNAVIIGASGLITPSLFQMEELCREMARRGLDTPLFIGGATTSALHTAVKLAPLYGHVFYSQDASSGAVMAKKCIMDRRKFEDEEHAAQERLREIYESRKNNAGVSVTDAGKAAFAPESFLKPEEHSLTDIACRELSIDEVMVHFDWRMFLAVWGIKYGTRDPEDPEMAKLVKEGNEVLEKYRREGIVKIMISGRILRAKSLDNGIEIDDNGKISVLPVLRQESPQKLKDGREICLSISDFLPSDRYGTMGVFAISVRSGHGNGCECGCNCHTQDYGGMMERSVRVTLAEAASEWLDCELRKHIKRDDVKVVRPAAGYACCPDHTLKKDIMEFLPGKEGLGISFTESYAMIPDASICGFVFAHPEACYPEIHHISRKQYEDYAARRGLDSKEAEVFLGHLLD
ncbi:MAG: methionine synthase [Candidatus Cryptobacteroides sp.]